MVLVYVKVHGLNTFYGFDQLHLLDLRGIRCLTSTLALDVSLVDLRAR